MALPIETPSMKSAGPRDDALVEIGLIVAGPLDLVDEAAIRLAMDQFTEFVESRFPNFRWHIVSSRRPESATSKRTAPSVLLKQAMDERDAHHWDFVFVVTAAELESYYSSRCFAALSRPLDAAVFSLSLIDPRAIGQTVDMEERVAKIGHRMSRLMLNAVGHLSGLARSSDPNNLLFHPATATELDLMNDLSDSQIEKQNAALMEIADQRLEEHTGDPSPAISFTARSAAINVREIGQAIFAARPWEFPRRLSGLTLASVSTLVILLLTAESWDLARLTDDVTSGRIGPDVVVWNDRLRCVSPAIDCAESETSERTNCGHESVSHWNRLRRHVGDMAGARDRRVGDCQPVVQPRSDCVMGKLHARNCGTNRLDRTTSDGRLQCVTWFDHRRVEHQF